MTKRNAGSLILILASLFGIYFHTNSISITHHHIQFNQGKKRLKIAHVSDLHTNGMGRLEEQLIVKLKEERPDIILLTGDLATPNGTWEGYKSVLSKLKAFKGTFFVQGNWEYWSPIQDLKTLLKEEGITDLTNQTFKLDEHLWLVGFDDSEEGQPQVNNLKSIPANALKIGIFHSPQFFDSITGKIQLSFAGHSHGGQVRVPFWGAIWLPRGTGKYDQGWFEKDNSRMYVSRGIGTSILPIRFNCSPELAIIELSY